MLVVLLLKVLTHDVMIIRRQRRVETEQDAIIYDPSSKTVLAFNGKSNDVTVIDADAAPESKAKATLSLGGKPEFAASDGAGP